MHRSPITSRLALSLSTLTLALLTACGGGGGDAPVTEAAPVQALPAASPVVCGVPVAPTAGPEAFDVIADKTWEVNGLETRMTLMTSPTGYSYGALTVPLALPMEDLREASLGYTPAATRNSMGVEMGSEFAPGAVGCVIGVSRVIDNSTTEDPNYLVSWASELLTNVPVDQLPAQAVNGFEFTHNFPSTRATAVFRMNKDALTDTGSVQICHLNAGGVVNCAAPVVTETDDGLQWTFKRDISESGIYMLSAKLEPELVL